MPIFIYSNPKNPKKIIEVIQGMNDDHRHFDKNGVEWNRVWTIPQGSISTKIDPWNQQSFIDKVGAKGDSLGSTWDRSKELSDKRAQEAGGIDPIKSNYEKEYSKKRNGKSMLEVAKKGRPRHI